MRGMSASADRVALEGLRLFIREVVHEVLTEERPTSTAAVEGYIGCTETARRAGVEPAAVRRWVKAGLLAAVKPPGTRGLKIKPADLDAFMQSRGTAGVLPPADPIDLTAHRLAQSIARGHK